MATEDSVPNSELKAALDAEIAKTAVQVEELDREHSRIKQARETIAGLIQNLVRDLERMFPDQRRLIVDLLDGERQRIMSEITASQARRSASAL